MIVDIYELNIVKMFSSSLPVHIILYSLIKMVQDKIC